MVALRLVPRRPPRRPRRRLAGAFSPSSSSSSSSASSASSLLRSLRLGCELGGDQSLILGPEIDLVVEVDARAGLGFAVGLEALLALERLDLLDRHLELVGDPRVRAPLTYPGSDSVQLWS